MFVWGLAKGKREGIRNGSGAGVKWLDFFFYFSCEECVGFNWRECVG